VVGLAILDIDRNEKRIYEVYIPLIRALAELTVITNTLGVKPNIEILKTQIENALRIINPLYKNNYQPKYTASRPLPDNRLFVPDTITNAQE
jgi:hypothetical protein